MCVNNVAALLESGGESIAVSLGERTDLLQVLGVDVVPVALNNADESDVLQAALPCGAQRVVELCHLDRVLVFLVVVMQQLCRTCRLLQLVDAIFDALSLPGQAVGHHTGSRGATTERREPHCPPGLRRVVVQIVHEHQIMREDDDLAVLRFFHETLGHLPSPAMVQRGHRVIEDQSRAVHCGGKLGHEGGQRHAGLFPFAQDFVDLGIRLGEEAHLILR